MSALIYINKYRWQDDMYDVFKKEQLQLIVIVQQLQRGET